MELPGIFTVNRLPSSPFYQLLTMSIRPMAAKAPMRRMNRNHSALRSIISSEW